MLCLVLFSPLFIYDHLNRVGVFFNKAVDRMVVNVLLN